MNTVTISGNLTRDPESKFLPNGTCVCEVSVAVNERFKQGDEWQERTHFVDCTAWAKQAEWLSERGRKGSGIVITGTLTQESWEDKTSGQKRSKLKVTIREWELTAKRESGNGEQSSPAKPHGAPKPQPDPGLDAPDVDSVPF